MMLSEKDHLALWIGERRRWLRRNPIMMARRRWWFIRAKVKQLFKRLTLKTSPGMLALGMAFMAFAVAMFTIVALWGDSSSKTNPIIHPSPSQSSFVR